jgi:hypothetical protein
MTSGDVRSWKTSRADSEPKASTQTDAVDGLFRPGVIAQAGRDAKMDVGDIAGCSKANTPGAIAERRQLRSSRSYAPSFTSR